jgi:fatty-acyl-CoA synthase
MFSAIAQLPEWERADLSSLRTVMCGGAPVPLALIRTYLDRGVVFLQGYGMTETSPGALFLDAEHAATKAGTAGVSSFFTDVRVVRPDMTGTAAGESGEIVVAGPNVMQGYWGLPDETAAVLTDGEWFHSGDVAVRDDDGYVRVTDRIKDLIISGGENISPAEVENALYEHAAVSECAVIGVPDKRWGEVGRAVVVTKPGTSASEEELLAHLDGRIARFKKPKSVVFVDSLPRGGAGKVLKQELRHTYGSP